MILSFFFDLILSLLIFQPGKQQQRFYFFSTFTVIEYTLFGYFFYLTLQRKLFKTILRVSYIVFIVIAFLSMIFTRDYNFDSICAPIESILVILLAIFYFYEQLSSTEPSAILPSKTFWIIVAFLIYLSASLFLFISTAYLSAKEQETFWPITNVANIIKNVLFGIAIIKPLEPPSRTTSRDMSSI
jgi:hypothetical protein